MGKVFSLIFSSYCIFNIRRMSHWILGLQAYDKNILSPIMCLLERFKGQCVPHSVRFSPDENWTEDIYIRWVRNVQ